MAKSRTPNTPSEPFTIYLKRDRGKLEADAANLLSRLQQRQAALREILLVGFIFWKNGVRLDPDPDQERLIGLGTNGSIPYPGAAAVVDPTPPPEPGLKQKYGNLT